MKDLYVFCEGATEQGFVNQVLRPHLYPLGFTNVPTIQVAFSKHHGVVKRGGVRAYGPVRKDILNHTKQRGTSPGVFYTTMIDLYGLPMDFPGRQSNVRDTEDPIPYVEALEAAFGIDIGDRRFIPYLQLHEYETLLFSDPNAFAATFENAEPAIAQLHSIAGSVSSVELIDDGEESAPSKRIIQHLPAYKGRKSSAGPDVAERIGLAVLRAKCLHFDSWIRRLEALEPLPPSTPLPV